MTALAEIIAEDRRLAVLRTLEEAPGTQLNEGALQHVLGHLGHQVGHDIVRADLAWLEKHGLVRTEKLPVASGELWLAKLTLAGADVSTGRSHHPGVARREPD
jgi:hypothetical protein